MGLFWPVGARPRCPISLETPSLRRSAHPPQWLRVPARLGPMMTRGASRASVDVLQKEKTKCPKASHRRTRKPRPPTTLPTPRSRGHLADYPAHTPSAGRLKHVAEDDAASVGPAELRTPKSARPPGDLSQASVVRSTTSGAAPVGHGPTQRKCGQARGHRGLFVLFDDNTGGLREKLASTGF